jgi:hypothetical protein
MTLPSSVSVEEAWLTATNDKQKTASNQRIETISLRGVAIINFIDAFMCRRVK